MTRSGPHADFLAALEFTDTTTLAISVTGIEVLALKKLAVICGALADSLPPSARSEQRSLTRVLVEVINRLEGLK